MDSTLNEIKSVTPKNKYPIFYYKIPVSVGSPFVIKETGSKEEINSLSSAVSTKCGKQL
jgi:hypothetical protein